MAAALFLVSTRLGVIATIAALLMGFSRMYVGAHYPHDVAAGIVVGVVVGLATVVVAGKYATPLVEKLSHSRLRPALVAERAAVPTAEQPWSAPMSGFVDRLPGVSAVWVYVFVGLLVFLEDAIFVGFVLPGETSAVLGGVAASFGHVNVVAIAAMVVLAAIAGDSVGYEVGKQFGPRMLERPFIARRRTRLDAAQDFLARPKARLRSSVASWRSCGP